MSRELGRLRVDIDAVDRQLLGIVQSSSSGDARRNCGPIPRDDAHAKRGRDPRHF